MYMGKVLTSCRPPLLSSQAGGQGHFALLTLSLAFGPVKSDHIWKGICAIIWVEKKWLVLAVAMFCHSSFLIRDKALGQLR